MKKWVGVIVAISLAMVAHNSCGGGGGGGGTDTQAPTGVTITGGITAGQVVSGTVLLTATAQDNSGSIQKIEFYVATNPVLACTASGPKPSGQNFSCNWDSRSVADGPHTLTAKAYDAAGNTANSPEINFTVNNAPPSAPTGVQAVAGNGQVTVSWNAVAGATSYNLYWGTSPGVTKQNGTKIAGASSPYVHTGLTNGTTYYYVVTAQNANGESVESGEVSATPQPPPPSAPTGVQAVAGNGQVTVSWNAVAGATSYNLYWGTSPGVTKQNGTKIAGASSPYVHTGLTNGTTYYYVVTAQNANGESVESGEVSATPSPWVLADLYSTAYNSVKYINLVKAPNGDFHLAFYEGSQGPMWAVSSGSNPSGLGAPSPIEDLANRNGNYGLDLSFAISADNEPSAGYNFINGGSRLPVYASHQTGGWVRFPGLGPFSDAGYHTTLIRSGISGEGDDFLAYANYSNPGAGYVATITHCTPNACDLPKNLGVQGLAYSALAIGGNADPVLIFYLTPGTNSSLQLIICPGMTCSSPSTPVTLLTGLGTVDLSSPPLRSVITGNTAWVFLAGSAPASLKCVASSRPAIATECTNPANWTRESISSDTATWLSVAVHPTTNLPIVAYTTSANELKYARYGSGWGTPETVVSSLPAGSGYPAIGSYTVGPNGFVAIVFFDAGPQRIRIGTRPE